MFVMEHIWVLILKLLLLKPAPSWYDQGCCVFFILSEIYSELRIRRHAVSWMEWKTKTLQESHTESPWLVNLTSKWQFARCCCSAWSGRSDGKLTQRHCLHMLIQINFPWISWLWMMPCQLQWDSIDNIFSDPNHHNFLTIATCM